MSALLSEEDVEAVDSYDCDCDCVRENRLNVARAQLAACVARLRERLEEAERRVDALRPNAERLARAQDRGATLLPSEKLALDMYNSHAAFAAGLRAAIAELEGGEGG